MRTSDKQGKHGARGHTLNESPRSLIETRPMPPACSHCAHTNKVPMSRRAEVDG